MTFLKKLGSVLLKIGEIVTGFGPVLSGFVPSAAGPVAVVTSDLKNLGDIIATVEAVGQSLSLPGTQKLIAATPLIAQAILQSELLVGRTIADPAGFQTAASKVADGIVGILNALKPEVPTVSKT